MDEMTKTSSTLVPAEQRTTNQNNGKEFDGKELNHERQVPTKQKRQKLDPYGRLGLRQQLYMETRAMAEYALAKGIPISVEVIKAIELFQAEFENATDAAGATREAAPQKNAPIDALVQAHDTLAQVVEPATPQTILLLDMEQEAASFWKFLGPVAMVRQMMAVAIVSLALFIGLSLSGHVKMSGGILDGSGFPLFVKLLFLIASASMGTCFAALYRANSYITKGTFDPTHQSAYWIRCLLGVLSGLMLAVVLSDEALQGTEFFEPSVLRPLLAIVGGFSADLVYTFFNRLVETLRSLFQGSTETLVEQKAQEAQVRASSQVAQTRMQMISDLLKVQQELGKTQNPDAARETIGRVLEQFLQESTPGSAAASAKQALKGAA